MQKERRETGPRIKEQRWRFPFVRGVVPVIVFGVNGRSSRQYHDSNKGWIKLFLIYKRESQTNKWTFLWYINFGKILNSVSCFFYWVRSSEKPPLRKVSSLFIFHSHQLPCKCQKIKGESQSFQNGVSNSFYKISFSSWSLLLLHSPNLTEVLTLWIVVMTSVQNVTVTGTETVLFYYPLILGSLDRSLSINVK